MAISGYLSTITTSQLYRRLFCGTIVWQAKRVLKRGFYGPPPLRGGVRVGVDMVPKLEKIDFGQKIFFSNFSFFEFLDPKNGQKSKNSKIEEFWGLAKSSNSPQPR